MNIEIQPKYEEINVVCSCGETAKVRSTICKDLHIEVCSACHPFYTGKQKGTTSGGRIDRFNRRFKKTAKEDGAAS